MQRLSDPELPEEEQPLIEDMNVGDDQVNPKMPKLPHDKDYEVEGDQPYVTDAMTYHTTFLKSWSVFLVMHNTVWVHSALWHMMGRLLCVTILVAGLTFCFFPDPMHLNPGKFREITVVLNIFLGLMLSFFLAQSVNRWMSCVDGFLDLFNAIRNLAMQFHALGADRHTTRMCLRYGVISAAMLIQDLKQSAMKPDARVVAEQKIWQKLVSLPRDNDCRFFHVTENEHEMLRGVEDVPGQIWVWIGSLIGRMAVDGEVPPMASPTYGRIMNLCQLAQNSIRQVRTAMSVRTPFIYVHTLATLVHVTNVLFAVSLGLVIGSSMEGIIWYAKSYWYDPLDETAPLAGHISLPTEKWQSTIVELLKCVAAPMLYQAFFMLACSVSNPFSNADASVPVNRMLWSIRVDLADAEWLADNPPCWETASFKPKPQA